MEDSHRIIFLFSRETKKTTIMFACVQTSATIGGPESSNRLKGKICIPVIHELVSFFLDILGAKNQKATIPSFTTGNVSIFRQALYKDGAAKITKDLRLHGLLPESVEFLSPSQAGGFCGMQGAIRCVAMQMELKTGEMPSLEAAASKLGRTSGRKSVGKPKGNAEWAKVVQISGSDEEIQGTEKCADTKSKICAKLCHQGIGVSYTTCINNYIGKWFKYAGESTDSLTIISHSNKR